MLKKIHTYLKERHRLPLATILCLFAVYISAHAYLKTNVNYAATQLPKGQAMTALADSATKQKKGTAQKKKIIYSANIQKKLAQNDFDILVGNVEFEHEGAFLYCDSAHFNQLTNQFDAYDAVRMEQGDTIFLYGDYMHYDGNTQLAIVRHNVMMENRPKGVKLYTDSLDYDRVQNIAYYFDGGKLVDPLNELTSYWGQYEPNIELATFYDGVVLTNKKFKLYSDTLLYNTGDNIATIVSKTKIESDSGIIHTSRGWHNTRTEESVLFDQSTVENKMGSKLLTGDTILYDKAKGLAEVFGHMHLIDTLQKIILRGNYGLFNELTNYGMATDSAYAIDYSQGDSLFIHADTLKLTTMARDIMRIKTDSTEIIVDIKPPIVKIDTATILLSDTLMLAQIDSTSTPPHPKILLENDTIAPLIDTISEHLPMHADTLNLAAIPHDSIHIQTDSTAIIVAIKPPVIEIDTATILLSDTLMTAQIDSTSTPPHPKILLENDSIASLINAISDHVTFADSLKEITPPILAIPADTIFETIFDREIKAYYGVRFYRSDMQGICDSMQFNSRDSILHLYRDPVLWNEKNQLSGDTINIHFNDSTINYVHVKKYSFSIEQKEDTTQFNQMKGRSLKAFFEGGDIRRILIEGNAESIFYPEEKDKSVIGLNYLLSSYLEIWILKGEFQRLKTWPKSEGKMTPLFLLENEQKRLPDFYWYDYLRPLNRYDIFRKVKKRTGDIPKQRTALFDRDE